MKIILALFLTATAALAGNVSLAWNPSPDADVTHYELWVGVRGGHYIAPIKVAGTDVTVRRLVEGRPYYFAVRACANGLFSDFSNELEVCLEKQPRNLRVGR